MLSCNVLLLLFLSGLFSWFFNTSLAGLVLVGLCKYVGCHGVSKVLIYISILGYGRGERLVVCRSPPRWYLVNKRAGAFGEVNAFAGIYLCWFIG